jgi:hypothetical protein
VSGEESSGEEFSERRNVLAKYYPAKNYQGKEYSGEELSGEEFSGTFFREPTKIHERKKQIFTFRSFNAIFRFCVNLFLRIASVNQNCFPDNCSNDRK